jgi:hypothetical protein
MSMTSTTKMGVAAAAVLGLATAAGIAPASATVFSGNVYYTLFTGGTNVWKVPYSYDDSVGGTAGLTLSSASAIPITASPGADGIVFAPNGDLLIGGQATDKVYEFTPAGTPVTSTAISDQSYHLTVAPDLSGVYTSNFEGRTLFKAGLSGGLTGSFTSLAISGDDPGVTQVAFAPNGNVFYVDGNPNGFGNLGTIDLATGVTIQQHASVQPAHGLIYDPFTGKMTIFGAGYVGTFDADTALSNLATFNTGVGDFDQGAVDGLGHALVAGSNSITFIDYSTSHDITNPDFVIQRTGFVNIDDVAPLAGAGSQPTPTPEPASLAILGAGLAALGFARRRRRR